MILPWIRSHLEGFLKEDIGTGDLTTELIRRRDRVKAIIVAKERGVLAGSFFSAEVFRILGDVEIDIKVSEGEEFGRGTILMEIEGDSNIILMAERASLNILQKLSGIATFVRNIVKEIKGKNIKILDTRKTTPGLRYFEKYAVRVGGGYNHRFDLSEMILIKDNHKRLAGGIREAIRLVKKSKPPYIPLEVEVENMNELEIAIDEGVDIIMLDNFSPDEVKRAVNMARGKAKIEVSGGINEKNIKDYAIDGVDYISIGSAIPSAKWIDMSLMLT